MSFYRYHLKGPKVGTWEIMIDNLPALVDNITPARHGPGFWAAGVVVRYGTMLDFVAGKPWIRNIAAKVTTLAYISSYVYTYVCLHTINSKGFFKAKKLHGDT